MMEEFRSESHIDAFRENELVQRFVSVRETTEKICRPLSTEDFIVSATADTSPIKWHLAHTSWFFEHFLLCPYKKFYQIANEKFNYLFNSYYMGAGEFTPKLKRALITKPGIEEVFQYRNQISDSILKLLQEVSGEKRRQVFKILEIGINHEEQHQELILMDIKRNFFENPLRPQYLDSSFSYSPLLSEPIWQPITEGMTNIGVTKRSHEFSFDNERDQHRVWIDSFQLNSHLVTNHEYIEFVEDGGYENPLLWLSDGWSFKEEHQWRSPLYWEKKEGQWWYMTLSGMAPIDESAPLVHVSYYEAKAFAQWKGSRLPTEFEWEKASSLEKSRGEFMEDGIYQPEASLNNHDIFSQMHGTVWEWTESAYLPYPRYEAFSDGLSEYNGKFMCNQMVLRGGSCITPEQHYRASYRNFYYPHMRWQFAGIRLAKDGLV